MPQNTKHFHKKLWTMQYACFDCRKSYKQLISYAKPHERVHLCPQCRAKMWKMGVAFKAPRQNDIRQWRKVEALVRGGVVFYSNHFGAPIPKAPRAVSTFLKFWRRQSQGERLLESIEQKSK